MSTHYRQSFEFLFTTMTWHEITTKLNCFLGLEIVLNKHLSLADYTDKVKRLYLVYVAMLSSNKLHEEFKSYRWKYKVIEFKLKMGYDRLVAADPTEVRYMLAEILLKAIRLIPQVRGMKQFDADALYRDVQQLCITEG